MGLHLVIGNKNYSSWSMRPWIGMKAAGIAFDETVISLNAPDFKPRLAKLSGTGKVPVLIDGDIQVWESLAILEYVAGEISRSRPVARRRGGARARPRASRTRCMPASCRCAAIAR